MPISPRILVVDPDRTTADTLKSWFQNSDIRLRFVTTAMEALNLVESTSFDAVVSEFHLDEMDGPELVKQIARTNSKLPVIIIARRYDSHTAIEMVKAGAYDFLPKPLDESEFHRTLDDAIQSARHAGMGVEIGEPSTNDQSGDALIGKSRAMLEVYKTLGRLSATPVTVLIQGETGTGKELVARAVYQYGHRSHRPFITINCAAIPENLLESELFGHEKGSFTGAVTTRIGKFEQAHNATLFLDEIGDLDLSLQAKLLRILQEKRFQRVGGNSEISVDVRIIAATHQNLKTMVENGSFREDLFYRLNVAQIKLPPLRERHGDIPLLARHFLEKFQKESGIPEIGITLEALERLDKGYWPGNVRQLQNVIRKAALNARGYTISESNIAVLMEDQNRPSTSDQPDIVEQILARNPEHAHRAFLEELEPKLLEMALSQAKGNLSSAAKHLGMSRYTLREKLRHYGLRD